MFANILRSCCAALLLAALVGCGGQESAQQAATEKPAFDASVRAFEPVTAAYVEVTGSVNKMGEALTGLMTWAAQKQVQPAGAPFSVWLTDPAEVEPEAMQYQVCLPVPEGTSPDSAAEVGVEEFGGLDLAVARHVGPFETIKTTYDGLKQWIDDHDYVVAGPAFEFYLSNPQVTAPDSLVTEVGFAVKPLPTEEQVQ
jgi:DNA gyrase inhibitor GyrI